MHIRFVTAFAFKHPEYYHMECMMLLECTGSVLWVVRSANFQQFGLIAATEEVQVRHAALL